MKVTVCFGSVRVVVPCGKGDIFVRDLIREAILRYKKATGKSINSWVAVHNLQSQGGGILDPDDRLNDVADDREQIMATFEDGGEDCIGPPHHQHGGGDGASGSSVGTGSPDIFHDRDHKYMDSSSRPSRTDIEITGEQIASAVSGSVLQVRRGSEPALHQLPVMASSPPLPDPTKRWSAAPIILEPMLQMSSTYHRHASSSLNGDDLNDDEEAATDVDMEDMVECGIATSPTAAAAVNCVAGFRRVGGSGSTNRFSMQFLGSSDASGCRWAEAADRLSTSKQSSASLPREAKRREPLGQANSSSNTDGVDAASSELIVIRNEPGPLGIHVVPHYDPSGKELGVYIQGIEPNGRIDRDGRLVIYDRIVEINGHNLLKMPLQRIQDLFKMSMSLSELRFKVIRSQGFNGLRKVPPPQYKQPPPPCTTVPPTALTVTPFYPRYADNNKENNMSLVECDQRQQSISSAKVAAVSPTKKAPATLSKNAKTLLNSNTRKIGRKIDIELVKGPHGLGFSITTRDNPTGGNCPIYIKNIKPKGAAIEDRRLQIGDRLLEVNGIEMTGKSQSEAVAILLQAPLGGKVKIVVSRQEEVVDTLPRIIDSDTVEKDTISSDTIAVTNEEPPIIPPLPHSHLQALQNRVSTDKSSPVAKIISQFQDASNPADKSVDNGAFPWKHREMMTLNIPVHDSAKAGLGISVKGKTSGHQDLGIFIKSVIHGGAASRDKRLRTNDQLLNVNGVSLLNLTNGDAMETLQRAMLHTEGPIPGNITLTIARRAPSPHSNRSSASNKGSAENLLNHSASGSDLCQSNDTDPSQNNSGASGSSTNTVIFNPNSLDNSSNSKVQQHEQPPNESPQYTSPIQTWNPVLERLTGNTGNSNTCSNKQLRNESYYKAAHDTWITTNNTISGNAATTLHSSMATETILIEDEYGSRIVNQHQPSRLKHDLSNNIEPTQCDQSMKTVDVSRSSEKLLGKSTQSQNATTTDSSCNSSSSQAIIPNCDATYASQLSLENSQAFSRDAFGRQSMSEKRHATLDAKSTDTYQRTKKLREQRKLQDGGGNQPNQIGPSLGMKKSSSLESLQTMVQEIQMQEEADPAYSYRNGGLRVVRGRGCEESIRAAVVDDSKKPQANETNSHRMHAVDPNHQNDGGARKHWLLDEPVGSGKHGEREIDGFCNVRGGARQSSLNAALNPKYANKSTPKAASKKPTGIFKGIGSMFRFGKHRKLDFSSPGDHQQYYYRSTDIGEQHFTHPVNANADRHHHHIINAYGESKSSPFEKQQQPQREPIYQRMNYVHKHGEHVQIIPENAVAPSSPPPPPLAPSIKYRNHHISSEQRREHRKVHEQQMANRHTYYQAEQKNDARIGASLEQRVAVDYGRPGSRSGITESAPFTHYVNYNELQSRISRKQHQYHSQRQIRSDNQLRPVSNFYEYESIQTMLNNSGRCKGALAPYDSRSTASQRQQQPSTASGRSHDLKVVSSKHQQSLHHHHHHQQQQQQQQHPPPTTTTGGGGHHLRATTVNRPTNAHIRRNQQPQHPMQQQHRGPFVTQVTIGEYKQTNGTKV